MPLSQLGPQQRSRGGAQSSPASSAFHPLPYSPRSRLSRRRTLKQHQHQHQHQQHQQAETSWRAFVHTCGQFTLKMCVMGSLLLLAAVIPFVVMQALRNVSVGLPSSLMSIADARNRGIAASSHDRTQVSTMSPSTARAAVEANVLADDAAESDSQSPHHHSSPSTTRTIRPSPALRVGQQLASQPAVASDYQGARDAVPNAPKSGSGEAGHNVKLGQRVPKVVPWDELALGAVDAGDCTLRDEGNGNQVPFCLPILVTLGQAKAGTGEVQRWLVEHPSLTAGMKNFYHLRGVGEAQYFNKLRNRRLCNDCWTAANPGSGPTAELLKNYLLVEDRGSRKFEMTSDSDIGQVFQTEKSPGYWSGADPRDVFAVMPSVQLSVVLRKPSDLVYSRFQYCHEALYMGKPKIAAKKCGGTDFPAFVRSVLSLPTSAKHPRNGSPVTKWEDMTMDDLINLSYTKAIDSPRQDQFIRPVYNATYQHTGNTLEIFPETVALQDLERWLAVFPRDQLMVHFMEDLLDDPFAFLDTVQEKLGVPYFDYHTVAKQTESGVWVVGKNSKGKFGTSQYRSLDSSTRFILDWYFLEEVKKIRQYLPTGSRIPPHWLNISSHLRPQLEESLR